MKEYPFIDMHVHLFNSHYLPLDGIFRSWGIPIFLSRPLAQIVTAITDESDFSQSKERELTSPRFVEHAETDLDYVFELILDQVIIKFGDATIRESGLKKDPFISSLNKIVNDCYDDVLETYTITSLKKKFDFENPADPLALKEKVKAEWEIKKLENAFAAFIEEIDEYAHSDYLHEHCERPGDSSKELKGDQIRCISEVLAFVKTLLKSERAICEAIISDYSSDEAQFSAQT